MSTARNDESHVASLVALPRAFNVPSTVGFMPRSRQKGRFWNLHATFGGISMWETA